MDGGQTDTADFGINSDPGDFLNSGVQGANDPFNEYLSNSSATLLTAADLKIMDVLGYTLSQPAERAIGGTPFLSNLSAGTNQSMNIASTGGGLNTDVLSQYMASSTGPPQAVFTTLAGADAQQGFSDVVMTLPHA